MQFLGLDTEINILDKKGDAVSAKVIKAMENIDDECDEQGIIFVKTGDEKKARSFGLTQMPGLVYFEDTIPNIYTGDLRFVNQWTMDSRTIINYRIERDVLDWLVEQFDSDEIEEVTDEILDSLIEKHQAILAVFCKKISVNHDQTD